MINVYVIYVTTCKVLQLWPVNSKNTWNDNLTAVFEAKLKAAIDNRGGGGVKKWQFSNDVFSNEVFINVKHENKFFFNFGIKQFLYKTGTRNIIHIGTRKPHEAI